jgi:HEAT repeat protein
MTNKHLTFLVMLFIASLISYIGLSVAYNSPPSVNKTPLPVVQNKPDESSQMETWLHDLQSEDTNKREKAKKSILALAGESDEKRQYVIKELLKIVSSPDGATAKSVQFMKHPELYLEWTEVTDILGTMKATEAIDALVQCLDCNDGNFGLSPYRFPATAAIIKIGEEAIPGLATALKQKSVMTRFMAAQALYGIGGDRAKETLVEALRTEKDRQTASAFKFLLRDWNNAVKSKA